MFRRDGGTAPGGRILTSGKNLSEILIYSAVQHAARRKLSRVMFHCGDAVNLAQSFDVEYEEITLKNIERYYRRYLKALAGFAAIQVGTRRTLNYYADDLLVVEKTPQYYVTYELNGFLRNSRAWDSYFPWALAHSFQGMNYQRGHSDLNYFLKYCRVGDARLMTKALNRLFARAGVSRRILRKNFDGKVQYLKAARERFGVKKSIDNYKILNLAERFVKKFNYEAPALGVCSHIKKIPVRQPQAPGG